MSKTYYIFRHGETYFSKTNTSYGENDLTASILPEAKPIIEKMAEELKKFPITHAVRSEFHRCAQTTSIIEENTSFKFSPEPLLNELTETDFSDFEKRIRAIVKKYDASHDEHIAFCTHGGVIAGLKRILLGKEFRVHDLMYYPKTGVILVISEGKIKEINCN